MPQYIIKCRVTLEGADMYVTADSPDDAKRKIEANEWDDIEYASRAALVDWEPTGELKLNE
jgi:hypothetical protein